MTAAVHTTPNISTIHDPSEGGDWQYTRSHPCATGMTSSPCKRRPDSGEPCPLLDWPKANNICGACDLRPYGAPSQKRRMSPADIKGYIDRKEIVFEQLHYVDRSIERTGKVLTRSKNPTHRCLNPHCRVVIARGLHCQRCAPKVYYWESKWRKANPCKPCPEDYKYQYDLPGHRERVAKTLRKLAQRPRRGRKNDFNGATHSQV